ncbi:MAG: hypothetical protein NVSMB64_26100 [Candidatus Velthaea sp.]
MVWGGNEMDRETETDIRYNIIRRAEDRELYRPRVEHGFWLPLAFALSVALNAALLWWAWVKPLH